MKNKLLLLFFSLFSFIFTFGQSDCQSAIISCGNSTISYTPNGYGSNYETIGGCMYSEHYSVWYSFTIATSGTLTFVIAPNSYNDYDFAVFGPNKACGNLGTPIRCSYASTSSGYNTGLNMTSTDLTEGAGGDGFVKYLDVVAGETYYLIVDNFSQSANGFTLTWGGTATIASPFNNQTQPFTPPGNAASTPTAPREIPVCSLPTTIDFNTYTPGILNGNTGFTVTYHTTSNGALTGTGAITAPVNVTNTTTTYYYAISAGNSACRQTGSFKFVLAPPANNTSLSKCSNDPNGQAVFDLTQAQTAITNQAGATFRFYTTLADAQANNNNFITNPTAYTSGNATLYVRVLTTGCVAQLTLIVNTSPTPTITSSATNLCYNGNALTLTASQTTGILWSTGETTPSINVTQAGTYTVTYNNGVCTSNPASITITSDPNPNVQITGNATYCAGGSTNITANTDIPNSTYSWSNGANSPTINVTSPGVYTATVTSPSGCVYSKSITVTELALPTANNSSLSQCSLTGTATYDLTQAQTNINGAAGVTYTFYQNLADAQANNTNNITNTTAYTSAPTTLYVVVNNGNCKAIAELTLDIPTNTIPIITASSNNICFGGSVTLTSNIPNGNTWSNGATTQSISITTPGTYTLVNSAGTCISQTATITITADTDPNVQISGNTSFCAGSNTNITASTTIANATYSWSNGATTPTINVSSSGLYTITVISPNGCSYTNSVNVTELALPTANNSTLSQCSLTGTATYDLTQAQGSINGSAGITYTYYQTLADAQANNANNITNTTAYTSAPTTLYVVVNNGSCKSIATLVLDIPANTAPIITASSSVICFGGSVTLTSNMPNGNTWSNGATTSSITITTPGTYTLVNTSGTCISPTASITITSDTDPNVQITGNLNFCGTSTTLTATSANTANTYSWSNGSTAATTAATTTGTYTVTVTTPSGCTYQKSVNVTKEQDAIATIAVPQQLTCSLTQFNLNASGSTYPSGSNISWAATSGGTIVSGGTTLNPTINTAGTYTLTITTPMGCSSTASVNVTANTTPPVVALSSTTLIICEGETVQLNASGAASYVWSHTANTSSNQTVAPTTTTTYTVSGIGSNGCASSNTATLTIEVRPRITSTITDIDFCNSTIPTLDAGPGPNYTYLWSTGETTQSITVPSAGTYTVTIDNGACSETYTAHAFMNIPTINEVLYDNNNLTIIATGNNSQPLEYSIDNGFTWQSSNVFSNVVKNNMYTINVRYKFSNCWDNQDFYTLFIPNVLTPNGDGINDTLDLTSLTNYEGFKGTIFDRYGKQIFLLSKQNAIWNGTYIGRSVPTGTYWYNFQWMDPLSKKLIERSGWIMIKNRD